MAQRPDERHNAFIRSVIELAQQQARLAEGCPLCHQLVATREWNIQQLQQSIASYEDEIAEIERGERHTDYHEQYRKQDL